MKRSNKRKGLTTMQLFRLIPTEEAAEEFYVAARWPDGVRCPHCGSDSIHDRPGRKPQRFRCRPCRKYFSPKTKTAMHSSNLGYMPWIFAAYLFATNIKGVSSWRLSRELSVSQKSAWHLGHRLRQTWKQDMPPIIGEAEVDESWFGGKETNKHLRKRLNVKGGTKGKVPVVGIRERDTGQVRAFVVPEVTSATLSKAVRDNVESPSILYTDEASGYKSLEKDYCRKRVRHYLGEYVNRINPRIHTNGIEAFWAQLKRGYHGIYHKMSPKHLNRYIEEFAGRHNWRPLDTLDILKLMLRHMDGKVLTYKDLVRE